MRHIEWTKDLTKVSIKMVTIKVLACAHKGFGVYVQKEFSHKKGELCTDALIFNVKDIYELSDVYAHTQSSTSLGVFLGRAKEVKNLVLDLSFLKEILDEKEATFNISYLNVRGNENRIALGKELYPIISNSFCKDLSKELKVNFKKPSLVFQLYFTGEEYLLGLRVHKEDLDQREYRVYAHQASFRGDFAYALVCEAELKKEDNCTVLFAKDATLSIEAAAFQNNFPLHDQDNVFFSELKASDKKITKKLFSIEESQGNTRSSKNNAKIAGISEALEIMKVSLDDVEVKIEHGSIDITFILMGRKDEERLNELYYQLDLILKKGGKAAILTRPVFELVVGSKFKVIKDKELHKGQSKYNFYLIEKN